MTLLHNLQTKPLFCASKHEQNKNLSYRKENELLLIYVKLKMVHCGLIHLAFVSVYKGKLLYS